MFSRRSRLFLVLTMLVMLTMVLAACGGDEEADTQEPIEVGAIFDLTGATGDVGTPYGEGVKGYVEWLNGNGGVNGREINLTSQDYAYDVAKAEQLYSQFVDQKDVKIFIGWGTGDTEALRSQIAQDEIPFSSASYSANLADMEAAPYNFLVGTTYSDQAVIAMRWAMEDWEENGGEGEMKVAVLHHDSPFGESPVDSWGLDATEFAEENDIGLKAIAMPGGATDLTAQLSQVESFGAQYIIIQNVSSPAGLLVKDAERLGMTDVQIIGLNWAADENLIELGGEAAEGVVGAIPFSPVSVDAPGFEEPAAFLESKGSSLEDKGLHYTQGWWTMAIMTEGLRITLDEGKELTGPNIRASLESIKDFDTGGVTAPISFSPDDHRGTRSLKLYQVEDGKWAELSDMISAD